MLHHRSVIGLACIGGLIVLLSVRAGTVRAPESEVPQHTESPAAIPLERAGSRVLKKPFGVRISPADSPVQPERFSGYHTGTDFELDASEIPGDTPVRALCDGQILEARAASGYGGIIVQSCTLNGTPVTVVYGHISLAGLRFSPGDMVATGDVLTSLGAAFSPQTDGERAHLHLGIHKGTAVDIRGYVRTEEELSAWIDPLTVLNL